MLRFQKRFLSFRRDVISRTQVIIPPLCRVVKPFLEKTLHKPGSLEVWNPPPRIGGPAFRAGPHGGALPQSRYGVPCCTAHLGQKAPPPLLRANAALQTHNAPPGRCAAYIKLAFGRLPFTSAALYCGCIATARQPIFCQIAKKVSMPTVSLRPIGSAR